MTSNNPFRDLIAAKTSVPIGTWLMSGAASTAEAMGCVGFEWLLLDMEHGPIDVRDAYHILHAIGATPAVPVVRLASSDAVLVKRVMDIGALTLMFPFIEDAEAARAAVAATRYPEPGSPIDGRRGYAAMHRASRYATLPDYGKIANTLPYVMMQLETPTAIGNLESIGAVPGVDAVFLGPGDLSAAMGLIGAVGHPDVQAKIADVAKRCRAAGVPCGTVGPTPEMVARFVDYGFDFVAIASDLGMMMRQAGVFLDALKAPLGKTRT